MAERARRQRQIRSDRSTRRRRRRRNGRRCAHRNRTLRWGRRDRRDHIVHQYVEPGGDARGGARCEEGRRTRARAQAVGENEPGTGLESRDGLSCEIGSHAVSRCARLQSRRVRLHDVYRQQRPASRGRRARRRRARHDRRRRTLGKSKFRGSHPSASACELSRLTAARRRLRARGPDGYRSHDGAARNRSRRSAGVSERHLADERRNRRRDRRVRFGGRISRAVRRRLRG